VPQMRDWRANSLAVSDRDGITQLHVPRSAARTEECDRLAWAFVDAAAALAEDDRVRRGVLITSGGRSFLVDPPETSRTVVGSAWQQAVEAVAHIECPVIAVINGDAIGPGWQLALACDLRIASAGLRVGLPELVTDGAPMFQPLWTLTREVGMSRAFDAAAVEPVMSAERAFALGLLTEVVPPERFDDAVDKVANTIRRNAPIAAAYAKEAVRRAGELTLADGMQVEQDLNILLQTTHDRAEGIAAFLDRRTPQFRGQ
jgi:enoyl-CoA hydratase